MNGIIKYHFCFFLLFRPPPEPSRHSIIAGDSRTLAGIFILRLAPYRRSNMRERRGSAPRPPRLRNSIALAPPPLGEKSRFLNHGERGLFSPCSPFKAFKASTLNPCTRPCDAWYFVFDVFLCSHIEFFFEVQ